MGMKGRRKQKNRYVELDDDGPPEEQSIERPPAPQHQRKGKNRRNPRGRQNRADDEFRDSLEADGKKEIVTMESDGNCLFRSLSDQLYHDSGNKHDEIRSDVCDFIELHEEEFSVFLVLDENEEDEDAANFEEYISNMRSDGEWGGNLELVAAARLYRRNIKVFSHAAAYTIEHGQKRGGGPDLMVSYHDNDHYNSLRDARGGLPPPPIKFMPDSNGVKRKVAKSSADGGIDDTSSKTKATDEETASKSDVSPIEAGKTVGIASDAREKRKKKKGGPCPCGSGVKYKDCCRKVERKGIVERAREKRRNERDGIVEPNEMEDNFRVLKV